MHTGYYQTFGIYDGKYLLIEELLNDSVKIQTDTYITSQFSVTIVRCGFTMDSLSSQNLSISKIQTVPGFAQNVNFSTFPIQLGVSLG